MEFKIKNIPFLKCNFQYQKELHSAYGKPNQRDKCKFISAEAFKFEIYDEFKDILSFVSNNSSANSILTFNPDKMNFEGTLPLISKDVVEKPFNLNLDINFIFNGKKLFEKLYNGETINVTLSDISGLENLANVKSGDITFNFSFDLPAMAKKAIPIVTPFLPEAKATLASSSNFQMKADSSMLDVILSTSKIDMPDYYKITKHEKLWRYKIDVQNYLWAIDECPFKETDDLDVVDFVFNKPNFTFEELKKDIPFKLKGTKKLILKIIHNHSFDNPFEKNPMKECDESKGFVLDEELEFSPIKSPVKGRKS